MKSIKIIEGVAAELGGKYWGVQYADGHSTCYGFGDLDDAKISNPKFCKIPTDLTWSPEQTNGYNPNYDELLKAKLVKIKKTIVVEVI